MKLDKLQQPQSMRQKGYKTFNSKANQMGGWNSVDKAANAMQAMGLMNLDDDNKAECDALNYEVHMNIA